LSDTTCDHLGLVRGTWGISYGLDAFMRAKAILLMVTGASKAMILKKLLAGDISLPAAKLLAHPDLTILADHAAMSAADCAR
jgi:6-phosphogluconolactonase/glucosamine-6-phosphate isomerase/deaminase